MAFLMTSTTETKPAAPASADGREVTGLVPRGDAAAVLSARIPSLPVAQAAPLPAITRDEAKELVLRRTEARGPAPKHHAEANERWRFLRSVHDHLGGECESITEACDHIVAMHLDEYEILGRKKLSTGAKARRNYNTWMRDLGTHANGRPDWDNVAALVPRYADGARGRFGNALCWEVFAKVFEGSGNKNSMMWCYRVMASNCRNSGVPAGEIPSYHQVLRWYRNHASQALVKFAREGEVYAMNRLAGHVHRNWDNVHPNQVWIADHHQLDMEVKVWDESAGRWVPKRPWITAWMDGRSLAIVGWCIRTESPNSVAIMEALRDGYFRNGLHGPEQVYTDNGADFVCLGLGAPYVTETGTEVTCLADLGVSRVRRAKVYVARSKTLERLFKEEIGNAYARLWDSYVGNSTGDRPDKIYYYREHPEELPTLGQFVAMFREVLDFYHSRPGGGKILKGRSPAEVWTRGTGGPLLTEDGFLLGLALPAGERTVGPGGVVRMDNVYWRSRKLWSLVGSRVLVRIDRVNGAAFACRQDGRLIDRLKLIPFSEALAESPDELALLRDEIHNNEQHMAAFRAAVKESTGGAVGLAPIAILQIDWSKPYTLETRGSVRSVKGPGHTFKRIVAHQGETHTGFALPAPEPAEALQGGGKGDAEGLRAPRRTAAETKELAEFEAAMKRGMEAELDTDDDELPGETGTMSVAEFQAAFERGRQQEGMNDEY